MIVPIQKYFFSVPYFTDEEYDTQSGIERTDEVLGSKLMLKGICSVKWPRFLRLPFLYLFHNCFLKAYYIEVTLKI